MKLALMYINVIPNCYITIIYDNDSYVRKQNFIHDLSKYIAIIIVPRLGMSAN